jgi:hypothetical protein
MGIAVVLVMAFVPGASSAALADRSSGAVTAVIDGQEVAVGVGSVISDGQPEGDRCVLPASEIRFTVPDNRGAFALEIRSGVNDRCDLVIESIKPLKNPPTSPPASESSVAEEPTATLSPQTAEQDVTALAGVRHYGWARHRVEEYINIWVTYTYVEMKYTRDGSRVYGGTNGLCRYWQDGGGWTVTKKGCTWNPNGPSSVWIRGGYHFSSWIPPQPEYTLWARFIADPGPRRTCSLTDGVVPWGWDAICTGGVYW